MYQRMLYPNSLPSAVSVPILLTLCVGSGVVLSFYYGYISSQLFVFTYESWIERGEWMHQQSIRYIRHSHYRLDSMAHDSHSFIGNCLLLKCWFQFYFNWKEIWFLLHFVLVSICLCKLQSCHRYPDYNLVDTVSLHFAVETVNQAWRPLFHNPEVYFLRFGF